MLDLNRTPRPYVLYGFWRIWKLSNGTRGKKKYYGKWTCEYSCDKRDYRGVLIAVDAWFSLISEKNRDLLLTLAPFSELHVSHLHTTVCVLVTLALPAAVAVVARTQNPRAMVVITLWLNA